MKTKIGKETISLALVLIILMQTIIMSTLIDRANAGNVSTSTTIPLDGWSKSYGESGDDAAYTMIQTSDGGFAIAGFTYSFDSDGDGWLVKTDANGDMQWNKTYGGSSYDAISSIIETTDNGFAMTGCTTSYGSGSDNLWLVKTDANGNMQWNKTYGRGNKEFGYSIIQTNDGGYALGSTTWNENTYADFWLVKTDANGNMQWNCVYGSQDETRDTLRSVIQTNDGGFALAGESWNIDTKGNFWLVKTDAGGNIQWNKTYDSGYNEYPNFATRTSDGGYAIVGEVTTKTSTGRDFEIMKIDANGNLQWNKFYGGQSTDIAYSVIQTSDGGYAITGDTGSFDRYGEAWLVKTDANGNMQWDKPCGGEHSSEIAYSVIQTNDNNYVIGGCIWPYPGAKRDFWLTKILTSEVQQNLEVSISSNRNEVKQRFNDVQLTVGIKNIGNYVIRDVTANIEIPENFEIQSSTTWNGDIQPNVQTTMQINATCKNCLTSTFRIRVSYLNETDNLITITKEKVINGNTWIIIDDFDEEGYTDISLSPTHAEKTKSLKSAQNTISAVWINKLIMDMPQDAAGLVDYMDNLLPILEEIIKNKEVDPEVVFYISEILFSIGLNSIRLRMDSRNPSKYNPDGTLTYRVVWFGKAMGTILEKVILTIIEFAKIVVNKDIHFMGLLDTQGRIYMNVYRMNGTKIDTHYCSETAVAFLPTSDREFIVEIDAHEAKQSTENYTLFAIMYNEGYLNTMNIQRGEVKKFSIKIAEDMSNIEVHENTPNPEMTLRLVAAVLIAVLLLVTSIFIIRKRKKTKPET